MLKKDKKIYLKSLAQTTKPLFQIGKEGISDNLIKTINDSLTAHELIKISILKNCTENKKDIPLKVAQATHADLIQSIGNCFVLYKKSKKRVIDFE